MDIFLNGELVGSSPNVVSYMRYENVEIGDLNGIQGGICNVVYFRHPLTVSNIYFLYKMVKDKTPPVINESNVKHPYDINPLDMNQYVKILLNG